ncbi:MAG: pilus assembly protein PilM [Desulfobacteraceae bacterium]
MFQTSLGIDIQDHAVSMAYLKGTFGGPRLIAHAVYPLEVFPSVEDKLERIEELGKEFLGTVKVSPIHVFLCVPRNVAIVRYLELPSAVTENLKESVGYQLEKYVPVPAGELYYDCQEIGPAVQGETVRVLLVAAKKEEIDPFLSLGTKLNVRFSGIELNSAALAHFISHQLTIKAETPVAFVYYGESTLEVGVLKAGLLAYSRGFDYKKPQVKVAEDIKDALFKARQDLSIHDGQLKTVLVGQGSESGIADTLSNTEGLQIRTLDLPKDLPSSQLIPAYGAALKADPKSPMEINLVPDALRKRPSKIGRYLMLVLAGLFVFSLLAWGGGGLFHQRLYVQRLDEEIRQLQAKAEKIEKVRSKVKQVEDRINFLNGFYKDHAPILEALKELTVRIPKNAWVQHLRFNDKEIRIDGLADSSSELVSLLDQSPIFKDVAFVSTISRDKTGKERFRIKLELE